MTVATTDYRKSYTSTGGTTYAYTWPIQDDSWLAVYVEDELQTLDSDYTVTGVGDGSGGTVVFGTAPTAGDTVVIIPAVPLQQLTDFAHNSKFPEESVENALDKLTLFAKQQQEQLDRTLQFPAYSGSSGGILPTPELNKAVRWTSVTPPTLGNYTVEENPAGITLPLTQANGGFGKDMSAESGSIIFNAGTPYSVVEYVIPEMFGGGTAASAGTNKTAFDLALADGRPLFIPVGTYTSDEWAELTAPRHIFGRGRDSKVIFNTTGDAIYFNPTAGDQGTTWHIHDLAFDNVTNTPASFIRNTLAVNVLLERLYFSNCAATFCIDNESGYGLRVRDCIFSDVTGGGIRLQDDGVGATKYSYAAEFDNCDFTRLSGDALTVDGTSGLVVNGGVIESCRYGLWTNYRAASQIASVQSWNIVFNGTYFESNTTDIKCETSSNYSSRITMIGCPMVGTPTIDLGTHGQLFVVGGQNGGGNECTISGSSEARVSLFGSNGAGFTQSGTFRWLDLGEFYDGAGSPAWNATGTQPALGDGVHTSRVSQLGNRVTYEMLLQIGSTSTMGTGSWVFGDSLLTVFPAADFHQAAGIAFLADASGGYEVGVVNFADGDQFFIATASGLVTAAVPWTWAEDDEIRLSITYRT